MDMIIDETLRLHPVSLRIDRETSNDYEYNNIKIKKYSYVAYKVTRKNWR